LWPDLAKSSCGRSPLLEQHKKSEKIKIKIKIVPISKKMQRKKRKKKGKILFDNNSNI
jgi:hypothetical protein